ncbi:hypothetical protein [Vibrio hyugaensis]|uniref:hypothetical protein n=1 Tax=Vibrio hyugaensis TaxID=1534743 RepID=UPI003DA10701
MERIYTLILMFFSFSLEAKTLNEQGIQLAINPSWGKAQYTQFEDSNQTSQWVYTSGSATLIIEKSRCYDCKEYTQHAVEDLNRITDFAIGAILVATNAGNGVYQVSTNHKEMELRTFKLIKDEVLYRLQYGKKQGSSYSFQSEIDFLSLINKFKVM